MLFDTLGTDAIVSLDVHNGLFMPGAEEAVADPAIERAVWTVEGVSEVDNRIVYTEGGETAEVDDIP